MTTAHVYDMAGVRNANLYSGKDWGITDLSALPDAFKNDFASLAIPQTTETFTPQKELPHVVKFSVQVIVESAGAGFSALAVKMQESNVGGTDADAWTDVGNTLNLTAAGKAGQIKLPTADYGVRHSKYYRLSFTATGGTAVAYAVAYGYNES